MSSARERADRSRCHAGRAGPCAGDSDRSRIYRWQPSRHAAQTDPIVLFPGVIMAKKQKKTIDQLPHHLDPGTIFTTIPVLRSKAPSPSPAPPKTSSLSTTSSSSSTPVGGYVLAASPIEINPGRPRTTLKVRNTGDRPIQVGSHFHFFETNRYLEFRSRCVFRNAARYPGQHRHSLRARRREGNHTRSLWRQTVRVRLQQPRRWLDR